MLRGKNVTLSQIDRNRLIKVFNDGGDWQLCAKHLGIKRQTARNVIVIFQREGRCEVLPKGGNRPKSLNDDMIKCLLDYVAVKSTATLQEMRVILSQAFPTIQNVSLTTISRALDGHLITLKDLRLVPFNWNQEDVKNDRKQYMQWMLTTGVGQNLIFCDEFGCNVWTARTKGRSKEGERAVCIVNGQRGPNLTVCLAISPQWGLLHWKFVTGGFTRDNFTDFITELETLVDMSFTLLCDNARPHVNVATVLENHTIHYLPRYSPFLNCAEMAGSCMKSCAKRALTDPVIQAELNNNERANQLHQSLQGYRLNILRREMMKALLQEITKEKCQHWFNHCLTYAPRCMNNEDIYA